MSGFGPGDVNAASRPLDVAFAQMNVREQGGVNRGPRVDVYNTWAGRAPEQESPWCCSAGMWCFMTAGWIHRRTASVAVAHSWAESRGLLVPLSNVEPGDMLFHIQWDGIKSRCHFAIADGGAAHPGLISSIEANTNKAGSRDGNAWEAGKVRPPGYWTHAARSFPLVAAPVT